MNPGKKQALENQSIETSSRCVFALQTPPVLVSQLAAPIQDILREVVC